MDSEGIFTSDSDSHMAEYDIRNGEEQLEQKEDMQTNEGEDDGQTRNKADCVVEGGKIKRMEDRNAEDTQQNNGMESELIESSTRTLEGYDLSFSGTVKNRMETQVGQLENVSSKTYNKNDGRMEVDIEQIKKASKAKAESELKELTILQDQDSYELSLLEIVDGHGDR